MAESTLPVVTSVTCIGWARENPGKARHAVIGASLVGVILGAVVLGAGYLVSRYIESIRPMPPTIDEVIVSPRDAFGSVKVKVKFLTSPTKRCLRIGGHMMLPFPVDKEDPDFDLMGGSLAGEGFAARTVGRFTATFYFPSTIEAGTYYYSYRRFMQCNPWNLIPFHDEITAKIVIP